MSSTRNVLVVTYHFPPSAASGSFRLLGFARHLPRFDWRATVVAPPSLPWEPVDPALAERVPAETSVYRVPYPGSRLARRLALFSCWLPRALRACRRAVREQRPDAVLTSGPPHAVHWLGYALKARYGLPWVASFRDPWVPGVRLERGRDLASRAVALQESIVLRQADAAVANTPGACQVLQGAYPELRAKFVAITNGFDPEAFPAGGPPPAEGRRLRLVHTGATYLNRDPLPVLDAMRTLAGSGRADLEACFFGPPPESGLDLAAEAARRGIADRVVVAGQVPYDRCLSEMTRADILLLMDSPGRTVGVPAKLYEYLGAGRPVLAMGSPQGDLAWVLRASGLPYRIVAPDDAAGAAEALEALAAEARAGAGVRPADGLSRFSREATAGSLAELLDRVVSPAPGAGQGGRSARERPAEAEPATRPDHDLAPAAERF